MRYLKSILCLLTALALLEACGLKDIEFYHALGVKHESKNDLNEAMTAYNEAIKLDPEHAPSLFNLGNLHFKNNNWVEARKHYVKALIENTNHASAWCNLGLTYLNLKERDRAYICFENSWNLDKTITALLAHADVLFDEGKSEQAIKILKKGQASEDPRLFYNLGMYLYQVENFSESEKSFVQARDKGPAGDKGNDLHSRIMIVKSQIKLKKFQEAAALLEELKPLDQLGLQSELLEAELEYHRGNYSFAKNIVDQHLKLFPDSLVGLMLSGELAVKANELDLAYECFSQAAKVDFTSKDAALRGVEILLTQKKYDLAREELVSLSSSFKDDPRILDGLMRIYFQQGYYDKAAGYGEKRIALGQHSADVEIITGLSLLMNEDSSARKPERGVELLWAHRNQEPQNKILLRYLYGALIELGDNQRASEIRAKL